MPEGFFDFREGVWLEDLEGYLGQRSETDFSHGSSLNTSLNLLFPVACYGDLYSRFGFL